MNAICGSTQEQCDLHYEQHTTVEPATTQAQQARTFWRTDTIVQQVQVRQI